MARLTGNWSHGIGLLVAWRAQRDRHALSPLPCRHCELNLLACLRVERLEPLSLQLRQSLNSLLPAAVGLTEDLLSSLTKLLSELLQLLLCKLFLLLMQRVVRDVLKVFGSFLRLVLFELLQCLVQFISNERLLVIVVRLFQGLVESLLDAIFFFPVEFVVLEFIFERLGLVCDVL